MTRGTSIRSLPLGTWPQADRLAFERALEPDDDGSGECGQATHLPAATIKSYSQTYGQYLDFLQRTGALDDAEALGDRVTPQRIAGWRRENKARGLAPTSRRQMLSNLSAMLRLLVPERGWSFVIRPGGVSLKRAIRGGSKPCVVRDVAEVMIRVRRLHRQGLALADGPRKWRALRDAAVLAILLSRAPRRRSLWELTTERHLEIRADGSWYLRFPGEHTKNGRLLDFPLDTETSRMLTAYLEHGRPRFPNAGTTDRLWLGMRGAMTPDAICGIAKRHTLAWYGKAHRPHDFRKW